MQREDFLQGGIYVCVPDEYFIIIFLCFSIIMYQSNEVDAGFNENSLENILGC